MKSVIAAASLVLAIAQAQVPPPETPRYPSGVEPQRGMPTGPANLNFHEGTNNGIPANWLIPSALLRAGYRAGLSKTGCKTEVCAVVTTPPATGREPERISPGMLFGNLMQTFDAEAYRGKKIKLRALIRLEASSRTDTAQLWMRIDCDQGICGFDNMGDRPVRSAEWKKAEISLKVPRDAVKINFGLLTLGHGRAWMDEVTFESTK